jgi:hypothetical protein
MPVVKVPDVPTELVFQKEFVPQVPFGVAPAPAVLPLLSQKRLAEWAVGANAAVNPAMARMGRRHFFIVVYLLTLANIQVTGSVVNFFF